MGKMWNVVVTGITVLNMATANLALAAGDAGPYSQYQDAGSVSPGSIDPNAVPDKNINPEQICAKVDEAMGKIFGNKNEEAYCAKREIPLDPYSVPSGLPLAADGSFAEGSNLCQFAVREGCPLRTKQCMPAPLPDVTPDWTTATQAETCKEAQEKISNCKYAKIGGDKQIRQYCVARSQATKGKKALQNMAILDATAAAMCAIDCFNGNEAVRRAAQLCGVAALGAGAQEFFQILKLTTGGMGQKNFSGDLKVSETGVTEKQTPAIAGLMGKVAGGVSSAKGAITGYKMATEYYQGCQKDGNSSSVITAGKKADSGLFSRGGSDKARGVAADEEALGKETDPTKKAEASDKLCQKAQRAVACSAMRTFAVLGGVRFVSLKKATKTVQEADKAIYGLLGQTPPVTGKGKNGSGSNGGFFGNNSGGNNGTSTAGYGSGIGSDSGSTSGWGNSADNGPMSFGAIDGSATDGRMLQGPLGRKATDKANASKWTEAKLEKAMANGAGGLMSSVAASMGLGSKIGDLASYAATSAKISGNDEFALPTYAAASGSKSHSSSQEDTGMGLGMGGEEASTETASNEMNFGRSTASDEEDIWHTGSGDSIFQIVTKKYSRVSGRVQ